MSNYELWIITYALKTYIESWFSTVYNDIRLIWRSERLVSYYTNTNWIQIMDFVLDDFKQKTSLWANIIHFSDGTVFSKDDWDEYMQTGYPIVWSAIYSYKNHRPWEDTNAIYMPLRFWHYNQKYSVEHKWKTVDELIETLLLSVRKSEEKMIVDALK